QRALALAAGVDRQALEVLLLRRDQDVEEVLEVAAELRIGELDPADVEDVVALEGGAVDPEAEAVGGDRRLADHPGARLDAGEDPLDLPARQLEEHAGAGELAEEAGDRLAGRHLDREVLELLAEGLGRLVADA